MVAGTTKGKKRVAKPVATTPRKSTRARKESTPENPDVVDFEKVDAGDDELMSEDEVYEVKPIISELTFDKEFFDSHLLGRVNELLEHQGWGKLFQEEVVVDEEAVREFYQNLLIIDRPGLIMANFVVLGKTYILTDRELGNILGIPSDGKADYVKGDWPSDVTKSEVILRVGEDETNSSRPGSSLSMGVLNRTLHRLFCASIVPRMQKHTTVNFEDFLILNYLLEKELISLPKLILLHMQHCVKKNTHGFPYPGFVKRILQHFDAYTGVKEVVMSSPLNLEAFEKVGWKFDTVEGWYNKKRETPAVLDTTSEDIKPDVSLLSNTLGIQGSVSKIVDRLDIFETRLDDIDNKLTKLISLVESVKHDTEDSLLKVLKSRFGVVEGVPMLVAGIEAAVSSMKEQVGKLQVKLDAVTGVVVRDVLPISEKKNPTPHA